MELQILSPAEDHTIYFRAFINQLVQKFKGVHLAYRAEMHNLRRLLHLCSCFSNAPIKMFLSGSPDDERLFEVLLKSYSGARYKDTFNISEDDSWLLYNKIIAFVALAKIMCEEKIAQLRLQAMLYNEFANPATASN